MRVVATAANRVEKLADLLSCQPGQLPLLQFKQPHPGKRATIVDLAQVLQLIERRADVAQFVVQGLPGYSLLQPLPPQARIGGCIPGPSLPGRSVEQTIAAALIGAGRVTQ